MKRISIVIPALNEECGIVNTINNVPKEKLENMDCEVQILVVDNGSDDNTVELARNAGAEVIFEPKRGYGSAYKTGFLHAAGDIIATADADATYPVEDIPRLIKILEDENLFFLTTDRFALLENGVMPLRKKIGNRILSFVMKRLFGINITDSQSGMWIFRRSILDNMVLKFDTMAFSEEIKIEACHFSKSRWKEVPIEYKARLGESKVRSWRDGFGNLFSLIEKRVSRGKK